MSGSRVTRYRVSVWVGRVVVLVVAIVLLQLAPGRWVADLVLAQPSSAFRTLGHWLGPNAGSSSLYHPVLTTVSRTLLGLVVGTVAALILAFVVWRFRVLARMAEPLVAIGNNLPRAALVPLFILWLGAGLFPVLIFVSSAAFFPMYYNVLQGLKSAERQFLESLAILGARRRDVFVEYLIPHIREFVLSAFMISIPLTFVSAIVAEMLMSAGGLGGILVTTQQNFDTNGIYAATLAASIIGVAANMAVTRMARRGRARLPEMWGL
jgi:NitT/TauT family transport system permease protein